MNNLLHHSKVLRAISTALCLIAVLANNAGAAVFYWDPNGTASVGYTGAYAEPGTSSHGVSLGGDGYLNGYYYDPKFMSFAAHPYYNRSQNNSTFQSISDSTGVNFSTNFFTGSRFPGFFSFNKAYDSSGTFGMPGASGLTTHGNAQGFSLGWSELLPDMPSLSASYSQGNGSSTLYGSDAKSESSDRVFDLHSDYLLVGFRLRGFFQHQNTDATFPGFLVGSALNKSDSSSNSYGFSADHKMPLNGDVYGGWHRSSFNYDYVTGQTNATTDSTNLNVTLLPVRKLSLTMGVNHISNLSGALVQEVVSAGGAPPQLLPNFTSASTQYNGSAGYTILPGLYVQGQVTHWQQTLGTKDYANTLFGGTVNYNMVRNFLGNFTFILGVMDNSNQDGHLGTTLISNVNGVQASADGRIEHFGSLLIGMADTSGKALLPEFARFIIFAVMATVLLLRPAGLFGAKRPT